MCIYLINQLNLNYEKIEHVIPAGLGGMLTLPKGTVSDEFNLSMAALEKEYMSKSIFAGFARIVEGPGRRGNLSDKDLIRSDIHVLQNENDPMDITLGYIKRGRPYSLPQLKYNISSRSVSVHLEKESTIAIEIRITEFIAKCNAVRSLKTDVINSKFVPPDTFLFGFLEEKKISRAFFARHPNASFGFSPDIIEGFGEKLAIDTKNGSTVLNKVISSQLNEFKPDYHRIHAKIAFNYLTKLYGPEFAKLPIFDAIRNWIIVGGENLYVKMTQGESTSIQKIVEMLPLSAHAVLISEQKNLIFGHVIIYGYWVSLVMLSRNAPRVTESTLTGLICDWKNRQEFSLDVLLKTNLSD